MRKRTLFLLFFALLVGSGLLLRDQLSTLCFEWYLKGYCRSALGGKLTYAALQYENGKWVFDHPAIVSKKGIQEGGFSFKAERAIINTNIAWSARIIDLSIELDSPHFDISKKAEEIKRLIVAPSKEYRFFSVHSHVSIPRGSLLIHHPDEDRIPVFFSIDLACKETRKGCAAVWLGEALESDLVPEIKAVFLDQPEKLPLLELDFNTVDLVQLQRAFQGLFHYSSYTFVNGAVKGKVLITLPELGQPYAEGELSAVDLELISEELHSELKIPKLTLNLSPKIQSTSTDFYQTVGYLDISDDALWTFYKDGLPFWMFEKIKGSFVFKTNDHAHFNFEALCITSDQRRPMQISGQMQLVKESKDVINLDVQLEGEKGREDTKLHFSTRQLPEDWNFAELQFSGIGREDVEFIQHLDANKHPLLQQLYVFDGTLHGSLLFYMQGLEISRISIEHITADQLAFSFAPWEISGKANKASGSLSFDLGSLNPIETLNADLNVLEGRLSLSGLDQAKWQFAGIQADLAIRKGVLQKSVLKGTMAGLKGEVILDGSPTVPLALLNFAGPVKDLAVALPETFRKGIDKHFSNDELKIIAQATKTAEGLTFNGDAFVAEGSNQDKISFGFALERSPLALWRKWPPSPLASEYYSTVNLEALQKLMPGSAALVAASYTHLIQHTLGTAGLLIKDGWFEANNLKLEKYVSPFAFPKNNLFVSGFGDFRGTFNDQSIVARYDARDFVFENDDFTVEIKSFSNDEPLPQRLVATHIFDLSNKRSFGTIPVRNATYFERNSGLLFTDINTIISVEDGFLHATGIETYCNGIYFEGAADVDWSMPGDGIFEVDMRVHKMHGKLSQVQHLFTHFDKQLFFFKLPLEGNIAFRNEGAYLHFVFAPGDYDLQTHISGLMTDGVLANQGADLMLQEVSMNFEYDHKANELEFSDIQGTLLVGTPNHFDEYQVAGDRIYFSDYNNNAAEFDLWVSDKKRDLLRMAGKTFSKSNGSDDPLIAVALDNNLSHFGDVHPKVFQLILKDWSEIDTFVLSFEFQLKTLFQDLQRFSKTGLLFLSRSLLKELNDLKAAEGEFKASLRYDGSKSLFSYELFGFDLALGSKKFKDFSLSGKKKGSIWTIDQLQLDDISIALDILKDSNEWNINFLGARIGNSLLLGLEGKFNSEDGKFNTKINLLEADLAQVSKWPVLQHIVNEWQLEGKLQATGNMVVSLDSAISKGLQFNCMMNGSLKNCKIKSLYLQDIQNMVFQYVPETGFVLSDVLTALKPIDGSGDQVGLILEKGCCNFKNKLVSIDNLHFNVPVANLPWLAQSLHYSFPGLFSPSIAEIIKNAKSSGDFAGSLHLNMSNAQCDLKLTLADGSYRFMNQEHEISDFVLNANPKNLNVNAKYKVQQTILGMAARANAPDFDSGDLIYFDQPLSAQDVCSPLPLTISWQNDPHVGFLVNKVEGTVAGINCDLVRNTQAPLDKDNLFLAGRVEMDLRKAARLLGPELAAKIANCELGEGYALQGQWTINKNENKPLNDCMAFSGELLGSNFEFYGYQFNHLSAQMSYSPETINIRNLVAEDSCGKMQIDEMSCLLKTDGKWQATVPALKVTEFRPSLLHSPNVATPSSAKTFIVKQLEVGNLTGILGDKNSFRGQGRFNFSNPPKKNIQSIIFAIPAEILMRIGLDLAVLNPVRGTVEYEIINGRIELKRFKDVYSKGRMSKFYLPNNGYVSYIDFDGNLNLQVRMKQYNLLFKLAELFTVNVQGTLMKPTYTLQKQQKKAKSTEEAVKNG